MLPLPTYMYVEYHTVYHDLPSAALFLPPPDSNAAADPYWFGRVFLLHVPPPSYAYAHEAGNRGLSYSAFMRPNYVL